MTPKIWLIFIPFFTASLEGPAFYKESCFVIAFYSTIVIGVSQRRVLEQNPLGQFIGDARAVADAVECEDELAKAPQGFVDQFWMFRLFRALFEAVGDSVAKIRLLQQCCQIAKFDPFLSLDCTRVEGGGCNPRKGRDQILQ